MSVAPQKDRVTAPRRRPSASPSALPASSRATPERRSPPRRPSTAPRPAPPPRRARRHPLRFLVFASIVVGGLVLGLTALNAVLAQGSFRIADLTKKVTALQQRVEQDQLQVAQLSAPSRISVAAGKLGMQLPGASRIQVIHLPPPASPGVRTDAVPHRGHWPGWRRPAKAVGGSG